MEGIQVPKSNNAFWKRSKGYVIYIAVKKLVPVPMGLKVQSMRVLNKIYGVSMDKGNNVILLTRSEKEKQY